MVLAAVGQICSTNSMSHNLAQCQTLVRKALSAGAKVLFLPEASDYIGSSPDETVSLCQPTHTSPFVQGLSKSAREHNLAINVGIHEPSSKPGRIRNTLVWISPTTGQIVHRYQKLHVFDIDLSDSGGPKLKESDTTEAGTTLTPPLDTSSSSSSSSNDTEATIPLNLGKIGSQICFDMRFAEPSLTLRRQGATLLLYPSAFTVPTGKIHWEVLLRARAVENQSWVVAAAQCGRHNAKRVSYGDAMVVGPDGVVEAREESVDDESAEVEGAREPKLLVVDVDLDKVARIRDGMPLKRRNDVYPEI